MVDTRMDGLPMDRVISPQPVERPMHDKAVNDGPTTANGLLSGRPQTLDDRLIRAEFTGMAQAEAARHELLRAGVAPAAVQVVPAADHPGLVAQGKPADDTLVGRIREAILPDEAAAAARAAVIADRVVLEVRPRAEQVEAVVQILQSSGAARFDADLERWRNKG